MRAGILTSVGVNSPTRWKPLNPTCASHFFLSPTLSLHPYSGEFASTPFFFEFPLCALTLIFCQKVPLVVALLQGCVRLGCLLLGCLCRKGSCVSLSHCDVCLWPLLTHYFSPRVGTVRPSSSNGSFEVGGKCFIYVLILVCGRVFFLCFVHHS